MARYASPRHALGISDRTGRAYKLTNMRLEWNKLLVGKDEFEAKQPQLYPRHVKPDPQALKVSRPDRTEPAVEVLLAFNPFTSGAAGTTVITVTEPGHNRETGDTVLFRNASGIFGRDSAGANGFFPATINYASGYSVTKVDSSQYTFDVSDSGSSEVSGVVARGGGGDASAGPITVIP